jgi:hypothetical protein
VPGKQVFSPQTVPAPFQGRSIVANERSIFYPFIEINVLGAH